MSHFGQIGEVVTTIPTIGFNVESVTYRNLNFNVWVRRFTCMIPTLLLWKVKVQATAANTVSFNCRIWGAKHRFAHTGDATMPILLRSSSLSTRQISNGWEPRPMNLLLC